MQIVKELLGGVLLLESDRQLDKRGSFLKIFQSSHWSQLGLDFEPKEIFYSTSKQGVIRGMHFQAPPYAMAKLVCCPVGRVTDVLLDLRLGSTYGAVADVELSPDKGQYLFIPPWIAHGFSALEEDTVMIYMTNVEYNTAADQGIHWSSIGYHWSVLKPIISERDQRHPDFTDFSSPF